MRAQLYIPLVLMGCLEPPPPVVTDTGDPYIGYYTGTAEPPPTYDDEGSVALIISAPEYDNPTMTMKLAGVFAENRRGWINLAQCLALRDDGYCATELPEFPETFVDVDPYDEAIPGSLTEVDVGPDFRLGAYRASKQEVTGDYESWTVYFNPSLHETYGLPVGSMDLQFSGGAWGEWTAQGLLPTPSPITVTSPLTNVENLWGMTDLVEVTWEPGVDEGDVMLAVQTPALRRLWRLNDDGQHTIDLSDFPLLNDDAVDISVGRWSQVVADHDGNDLQVWAINQQMVRGVAVDQTGRSQIIPWEGCYDADNNPPAEPGLYFGDISTYANDIGNAAACTGFLTAGQDGYLRVEVADGEAMLASYRLLNDDASFYVLDTCGAVATCLTGADATLQNDWESLAWVNTTGADQSIYLVLDSYGPSTGIFELDLYVSQSDALANTCADAIAMTPLTTGIYQGDLSTFSNNIDPVGSYGCGTAAPGNDAMAPVLLQDGETVTATLNMTGDPNLYFMYNCTVAASCISQGTGTNSASATYTNMSGFSEVVYLTIDSSTASGSYTLDILVQ